MPGSAIEVQAGLLLAARLTLVAFLAPAAVSKLADPGGFIGGVESYRILPGPLVRPSAIVLLGAELAVAACLLAGFAVPVMAAVATALFGVFLVAIALSLRRGRVVPCHCHVVAGTNFAGAGVLTRNAILGALAVTTALLGRVVTHRFPGLWAWEADRLTITVPARAVPVVLLTASLVCVVYLAEWSASSTARTSWFRLDFPPAS
jgi:hypothetical protein